MPTLREIIMSTPMTLRQAEEKAWRQESKVFELLGIAWRKVNREDPNDIDPDDLSVFIECNNWLMKRYPTIGDRTRPIIDLCLDMLFRPFLTPPLRALFSGESTIDPTLPMQGKIVIIDIPYLEYYTSAFMAQMVWKRSFQNAVLRRWPKDTRPVVLWIDEAQNLVTPYDAEYQAVCRSHNAGTVYITQTREGLRNKLKRQEAVDALLANLQNKFFCQIPA
jgi:hypothetical protein